MLWPLNTVMYSYVLLPHTAYLTWANFYSEENESKIQIRTILVFFRNLFQYTVSSITLNFRPTHKTLHKKITFCYSPHLKTLDVKQGSFLDLWSQNCAIYLEPEVTYYIWYSHLLWKTGSLQIQTCSYSLPKTPRELSAVLR